MTIDEQIAALNPEQLKVFENIANKIKAQTGVDPKEELQARGLLPSDAEKYLSQLLTQDDRFLRIKSNILRLVNREEPVLIQGESGTGKELIARALHGKRSGNFVAVNVTSLPDYLIESELFGHVRGSFTGAVSDKEGLFEYAKDGTVFLDEIGDMPYTAQAKLLRVIQERKTRRVGSNIDKDISCRIVCATHQDLRKLVKERVFRLDLFYRISTFILHTIPLRERPLDIELLLDKKLDIERKIPAEIRGTISNLDLPGNVRELEQIVLRYKVFGEL